jgi:hypothetical protein
VHVTGYCFETSRPCSLVVLSSAMATADYLLILCFEFLVPFLIAAGRWYAVRAGQWDGPAPLRLAPSFTVSSG